MIAVGILFMCLFAVLALTANSLKSARKIQMHRDLDAGTFVGYFYVQLVNTNRIDEGPAEIDLGESFPGFKMRWIARRPEPTGFGISNMTWRNRPEKRRCTGIF